MLEPQYRLLAAHIADSRGDSANYYLRQIVQRDRRNPQVETLREEYPELADQGGAELDLKTLEELELDPPEEDLAFSFRSELEEPPVVREMVPPVLPAGDIPDSAAVVLDLLVDEDGHAEEVAVFAGEERFREAAVAAARAYRFFPAVGKDGKEKKVWVELVISFASPEAVTGAGEAREADLGFGRAAPDSVSAVDQE
jgi:hypothetical protein